MSWQGYGYGYGQGAVSPTTGWQATGATEVWYSDALIRALAESGALAVSFEANPPSNTRQLWFNQGNPPTGLPGQWMVYDQVAETWVPLTPSGFIQFLSITTRAHFYRQATQPVAAEVMDMWMTPDNRVQILSPIAPNLTVWIDVSGAAIDPTTLSGVVLNLLNTNANAVDGGSA